MRNVRVLDILVFIMIKLMEWSNSIFVCLSMVKLRPKVQYHICIPFLREKVSLLYTLY